MLNTDELRTRVNRNTAGGISMTAIENADIVELLDRCESAEGTIARIANRASNGAVDAYSREAVSERAMRRAQC